MLLMGFSDRRVKWIMLYVTTVSYSISFNGRGYDKFLPEEGYVRMILCHPICFYCVWKGYLVR